MLMLTAPLTHTTLHTGALLLGPLDFNLAKQASRLLCAGWVR